MTDLDAIRARHVPSRGAEALHIDWARDGVPCDTAAVLAALDAARADADRLAAALDALTSNAIAPDALIDPALGPSHKNLYDWWHLRCAPAVATARDALAAHEEATP